MLYSQFLLLLLMPYQLKLKRDQKQKQHAFNQKRTLKTAQLNHHFVIAALKRKVANGKNANSLILVKKLNSATTETANDH